MVFLLHHFSAHEKTFPKARQMASLQSERVVNSQPVWYASILKLAPLYCVVLGERWKDE